VELDLGRTWIRLAFRDFRYKVLNDVAATATLAGIAHGPAGGPKLPSGVWAGAGEMRTIMQFSDPSRQTDRPELVNPRRMDSAVTPRIVVVSPTRVYRESLVHMLVEEGSMSVVAAAARIGDLTPLLSTAAVDVVLFDLATDGGLAALQRLSWDSQLKVVVLGLNEDEGHIVDCARAGIAGYVTQDANVHELMRRIDDAIIGEFNCPPRVAATLLRSLALPTVDDCQIAPARLTPREWEIVQLIERGLSNKEIAQYLSIQLATVKNHVHNILEKLGVRRRAEAVRVSRSLEASAAITGGRLGRQGIQHQWMRP
jgi:two-component system, NarL family, nitrate/nitrite response regulator NarL